MFFMKIAERLKEFTEFKDSRAYFDENSKFYRAPAGITLVYDNGDSSRNVSIYVVENNGVYTEIFTNNKVELATFNLYKISDVELFELNLDVLYVSSLEPVSRADVAGFISFLKENSLNDSYYQKVKNHILNKKTEISEKKASRKKDLCVRANADNILSEVMRRK